MSKEQVLKHMQDHILQLKALSDKGSLIRKELESLNDAEAKWFEDNFTKWLIEKDLHRANLWNS